MTLILSEEVWGPIPAIDLPFVLALNLPWAIFPFLILWRMFSSPVPLQPFAVQKSKNSEFLSFEDLDHS